MTSKRLGHVCFVLYGISPPWWGAVVISNKTLELWHYQNPARGIPGKKPLGGRGSDHTTRRGDTAGWRHHRGPPQKSKNKYFAGHRVTVTSLKLRPLDVSHSSVSERFLAVRGDNGHFGRWLPLCLSFFLGRDEHAQKIPPGCRGKKKKKYIRVHIFHTLTLFPTQCQQMPWKC